MPDGQGIGAGRQSSSSSSSKASGSPKGRRPRPGPMALINQRSPDDLTLIDTTGRCAIASQHRPTATCESETCRSVRI